MKAEKRKREHLYFLLCVILMFTSIRLECTYSLLLPVPDFDFGVEHPPPPPILRKKFSSKNFAKKKNLKKSSFVEIFVQGIGTGGRGLKQAILDVIFDTKIPKNEGRSLQK